jgi:hypothetical protein
MHSAALNNDKYHETIRTEAKIYMNLCKLLEE